MPTYKRGRHEHGQNFLNNKTIQTAVIDRVKATTGPIIEIGPGAGALTNHLSTLGRPLTAVEIDGSLARRLKQHLHPGAEVVHGDFLHYRLPETPFVLVGNLPFHQTTAMLRHILHAPGWTHAVLIVQWEVARRRAGIGGATMMTAQWWPWFDFELGQRVPAHCFTPTPSVDGGLLTITRRNQPLLPRQERKAFQSMVYKVFTGRGRGIVQIASRMKLFNDARQARTWALDSGLKHTALPKDLSAHHWVDLYRVSGSAPPKRRH